jgi:hypothetical protein
VGDNCPAGSIKKELGVRNHEEEKVTREECVKHRLNLRKGGLKCAKF